MYLQRRLFRFPCYEVWADRQSNQWDERIPRDGNRADRGLVCRLVEDRVPAAHSVRKSRRDFLRGTICVRLQFAQRVRMGDLSPC